MTLRLAMWSGPRNISTAMMRSWGNRSDTFVCDEPLYSYYLQATGLPHPGRDEIIAAGQTDWRKVAEWLSRGEPGEQPIFFQKHMTHHLLPEVDRGWLKDLTNCFLIRDPKEVIASYLRKNGVPTAEDLGYPQQTELFDWVRQQQKSTPPVLDAHDVLTDPRRILGLLCDVLGVPCEETMFSWAPGLRPTDGIWARHWYTEVEHSTGFRPAKAAREPLPSSMIPLYEECLEQYQRLHQHRLR